MLLLSLHNRSSPNCLLLYCDALAGLFVDQRVLNQKPCPTESSPRYVVSRPILAPGCTPNPPLIPRGIWPVVIIIAKGQRDRTGVVLGAKLIESCGVLLLQARSRAPVAPTDKVVHRAARLQRQERQKELVGLQFHYSAITEMQHLEILRTNVTSRLGRGFAVVPSVTSKHSS